MILMRILYLYQKLERDNASLLAIESNFNMYFNGGVASPMAGGGISSARLSRPVCTCCVVLVFVLT